MDEAELTDPLPLGAALPDGRRRGLPPDGGGGLPPRGRLPPAHPARARADLGLRDHGHVGLGDHRLPAGRGRGGDVAVLPGRGQDGVPRPGHQAPAEPRASSSSTRTTPAKEGSSRASSSASTGGRTSARHRIREKFGLRITKRSFAELGARAKAIPDAVGRGGVGEGAGPGPGGRPDRPGHPQRPQDLPGRP